VPTRFQAISHHEYQYRTTNINIAHSTWTTTQCVTGCEWVHCVLSHMCPKNDTDVGCYSFDVHQLTLVIFSRIVAERVICQMVVYLSPHLNSISALPEETWIPEIASSVLLLSHGADGTSVLWRGRSLHCWLVYAHWTGDSVVHVVSMWQVWMYTSYRWWVTGYAGT